MPAFVVLLLTFWPVACFNREIDDGNRDLIIFGKVAPRTTRSSLSSRVSLCVVVPRRPVTSAREGRAPPQGMMVSMMMVSMTEQWRSGWGRGADESEMMRGAKYGF